MRTQEIYQRRPYNIPQKRGVKKKLPFLTFCSFAIFCLWCIWKSVTPSLPQAHAPPKLYANPSKEDLRLTLLTSIQQAKKSLFICIFGLTDPSILRAIAEKINEGLDVTVLFDPKGSPDLRKSLPGANIQPIHLSGILHQKILIVDDELVFTGSTNFTTQSLKMHDNLLIGFQSQKVASFLKSRLPKTSDYLRTVIGDQDVEIWLLPDLRGRAIADLKKQIKAANHTLWIALFTLTHPLLIEEILHAKQRGVDVRVVLDLHAALGASKEAVALLQREHIPVRLSHGTQLMHHKLVWIDQKTLITGSANWTKSAFAKNSDNLFVFHHLNDAQTEKLKQLWKIMETSSKLAPQKKRAS